MSTSRLQHRVSQLLSTYFGNYIIQENVRPDWLIMDKGERLELDFLLQELSVAIEVQGEQHYRYSPHWHGSRLGFRKRLHFDEHKRRRCSERGIRLFEIADETDALQAILSLLEMSDNTSSPESFPQKTRKALETISTIVCLTYLDPNGVPIFKCQTYKRLIQAFRDLWQEASLWGYSALDPLTLQHIEIAKNHIRTFERFHPPRRGWPRLSCALRKL